MQATRELLQRNMQMSKALQVLLWFIGSLFILTAVFAIARPVKVVPRLADAPEVALEGLDGEPVLPAQLPVVKLFGFGWTQDPAGSLDQTLEDLTQFVALSQSLDEGQPAMAALLLFDSENDTLEVRRVFAQAHDLDPNHWIVLGGEAEPLKRLIGLGFGIYYERVPMAEIAAGLPTDVDGFIQEQRYVLVDEAGRLRAEYRAPLNMEIVQRDLELMARERNSSGAMVAVNEAAHLLMCYPR